MNVTVLRAYAVQLEEVAKLELAELSHALQQTVNRMAMLESRAKKMPTGICIRFVQAAPWIRSTAISTPWIRPSQRRKGLEQALATEQARMEQKRAELLEAMQYRKSSISSMREPRWRYDAVVSARISNYSMNVPGTKPIA